MKTKIHTIYAWGEVHEVYCTLEKYRNNDTLAICVYTKDGEDFGTLTANLNSPLQTSEKAFVKTYSENEGWALKLAEQLGKHTGIYSYSGFEHFPLYQFDLKKFNQ